MQANTPGGIESSERTETVSLREYAALEREFAEYRADNERDKAHLKRRLTEIEAGETEYSDQNPEGKSTEKGSPSADLLPIEHLRRLRESDKNHPALPKNGRPSFDRAVCIYEHLRSWSKKTLKGRTVTSGLKDLLETAAGETLYWSQVKRACAKLEEYSRGTIRLEKTRRHGNVLVASEQSVLPTGG